MMPERCNERTVLYHGTFCSSRNWLTQNISSPSTVHWV